MSVSSLYGFVCGMKIVEFIPHYLIHIAAFKLGIP
jgi:hypothetical protein